MSSESCSDNIRIDAEEAGVRLDRFLAERFSEHSRSWWQRCIRAGRVRVDGQTVKTGLPVEEGMVVTIEGPVEPPPRSIKPVALELDIIHEDDQVVIVSKPAGLSVHPAGAGDTKPTLVGALVARYLTLSTVGGAFRPGVVHRLDRDTTGLVVVARNDRAHAFMARQFAERTVKKRYIAVVLGALEFDEDVISGPIGRHPKRREMMTIRDGGRAAETFYRTIERFNGYTLVEVSPRTGRTHQIRVHMRRIGHPVAGDSLYGRGPVPMHEIAGRGEGVAMARQALHAEWLEIELPDGRGRRSFEAPWPEDLARFVELLRTFRKG